MLVLRNMTNFGDIEIKRTKGKPGAQSHNKLARTERSFARVGKLQSDEESFISLLVGSMFVEIQDYSY